MNPLKRSQLLYFYHLTAIAIVVILLYSKVPSFDFLRGWDDQWFVLNNYTEEGFTAKNLYAIATDFYYGQYAPVNQLYYTIVYHFVKYEPAFYHILNVLFHLLNAVLVYFLSRHMAMKLMDTDEHQHRQTAFFTAFLFAILPVNLEPVAWVAASKVGLYSFFYLLAIHAYLHYMNSSKSVYYYLCIFFFFLSFGAKEQAVTLPFCLLLIDYVYKRPFKSTLLWYEKAPFLILSLLFGLITLQSQKLGADRNADFYPFYERIVLSFYTLSEYFTKTVLPVNLSYLYPFPYVVGEGMPKWLWTYAICIPTVLALTYRYLSRWITFGLLFFLIHMIMVINLFSLARFSIVADRYTYISGIGLCFIAGSFIVHTLNHSPYRNVFFSVVTLYFCSLGLYTYEHSSVWKNANTLKEKLRSEIRQRPDYKLLKDKIKDHE